jgi:hypothetical protein
MISFRPGVEVGKPLSLQPASKTSNSKNFRIFVPF